MLALEPSHAKWRCLLSYQRIAYAQVWKATEVAVGCPEFGNTVKAADRRDSRRWAYTSMFVSMAINRHVPHKLIREFCPSPRLLIWGVAHFLQTSHRAT